MRPLFKGMEKAAFSLPILSIISWVAVLYAAPPSVIEPNWEIRASFDIGQNAYSIIAGVDIDQDGNREFVVSGRNAGQNNLFIFEATGDNTYQLVWSAQRPGDAVLEKAPIAVGDSDNDGRLEIVAGSSGANNDADEVVLYEYDPTINGGQLGATNPPDSSDGDLGSWLP